MKDGSGARFRPKHAGLFEALADGFAAPRLDHATADEPSVLAVGCVPYALLMALEEAQVFFGQLPGLGPPWACWSWAWRITVRI
ncbi:MAG: hypothetical protein KIT22_05770 [Verrucomicrobiae bacterium]|nr:hypothetical protein [Verrucomicrobiae bacterium]